MAILCPLGTALGNAGMNRGVADARVGCERTVNGRPTELSTGKASATERYYFVVECYGSVDGRVAKAFDVVVCRDGDRSALLVRHADGLPYSYMTNGFAVFIDPRTGQLAVWKRGNTRFSMRGTEGGVEFEIGQRREDLPYEFVLDAGSILAKAKDAGDAEFDAATETLRFSTAKASVVAELSPPGAKSQFVLECLSITGKTGNQVVVGHFRVDQEAPLSMFSVSAERMQAAGLAARELKEDELRDLSPFPTKSALTVAEAREAAGKLMRLFSR